MPQKRMECFRLLLEHLAWIEHRFLSGIRDSRKPGSLWGMMRGVGGVRKSIHQTWLKLVDKFTYLGSSVSSTEKDINTQLTKAWTAIDRLSIIWKSDLTDKMKRSFFQAAVVSILLYGYTTWTLTKRLERKLDGNYTRMLRAVLNKSWRQHPTRLQLYGHLPPITKTIHQTNQTRGTLLEKQGRAHKRCTPVDPHLWMCKSRTTSTNLHTATM